MTLRYRLGFSLALLPLLIFPARGVSAADETPRPTPVRIAYVSRSTLDMPYMIARDRGFFREEGLEPEFIS